MKLPHLAALFCFVLALESACGPLPASRGRSDRDAGAQVDGGSNADTGVTPPADTGTPPARDAGTPPARDAGTPPARDAGTPPARDAGTPPARDTGPAPCRWPTGNLGVEIGQSLPSQLAWQGLAPGGREERSISVQEFFDCDGSRGIHAFLIVTSQYGCSRCTSQAGGLTQMLANWREEGLNIQVLTLKIEDPGNRNPASMEGVNHWRATYNLTTSYVAYDNGYTMVPRSGGNRFGTPLNSIVDPRNMEVIDVIQTFDRSYASLLNLARRRAAER